MAKLLWEHFVKRFKKHFIGFYLKVKIKLKKNLEIKNSKPAEETSNNSFQGNKIFFVCLLCCP